MSTEDIPNLESVTFDSKNCVYIGEFNMDDVPASTAITAMISEVIDSSKTEISPLYESVNLDALNRLIEDPSFGQYIGEVVVTFSHHDHTIEVINEGVIKIYPQEAETAKESD
jgi:hypothetical protein